MRQMAFVGSFLLAACGGSGGAGSPDSGADSLDRDASASHLRDAAGATDTGSTADTGATDGSGSADVASTVDAPFGTDAEEEASVDAGSPAQDAGLPPDSDAATMVVSFQEGVDGYASTRSVGISTYGGLGNVGEWNANGSTFADGDNDWCTGTDIPSSPYSEIWLLRFDALGLTPGTKVKEATLTVHAYGDDTHGNLYLIGQYLNQSWNANVPLSCAGCSSAPVGWRYRDGSSFPWGALGAGADGVDFMSGKSFRLPESGYVALGSTPNAYTTHLDPSVVEQWISGQNHGLRILTGVMGVHMGYVQPQRSSAGRPLSMRPKLTISYHP